MHVSTSRILLGLKGPLGLKTLFRAAFVAGVLSCVSVYTPRGTAQHAPQSKAQQKAASKTQGSGQHESRGGRHVGSGACASCHGSIYSSFRQTSMGRSMLPGDATSLDSLFPSAATVYDKDSNQYFEVTGRDGQLYQGQYSVDAGGRQVDRQSWKLDYVIGAGANGYGFLVKKDRYLFEAPLCYYTTTHSWGFSPGFEIQNRGFTRPILSRCIVCHSGRPNPVEGHAGLYQDPPFDELAVGCENCHGPGEVHVAERTQDQMAGNAPPLGSDSSIVNPAKLSGWLADNICMKCHQGQDVRVQMPGKHIGDFRPGRQLGDFVSIFKIAPEPGASPSGLPLEHYFGMTLSKCYRASGNLHCVTCHDPHVESTAEQSYTKYRAQCMHCHTEKNCKEDAAKRQATSPPDDCLHCHMPKRTVSTIAHAALTDHSIPAHPSSEFQLDQTHLDATSELLVLSAPPEKWKDLRSVPQEVLLQAYDSLVREGRREFDPLLSQLLQKIPATSSDPAVLRVRARSEFRNGTPAGDRRAIGYMRQVERSGGLDVDDYLLLSNLYARAKQPAEAVQVLEKARVATPYFREVYENLASDYLELERYGEALTVVRKGLELFPDDVKLRNLEEKANSVTLGP